MYKSILVAIDLHGTPEQVLARAAELIDNPSNGTHILNVLPDPAFIYTSYPAYSGSTSTFDLEELRSERLERMGSLAEKAGLS